MAKKSALIMAGGRSARMRANGSALHKGLRTVLGAPLIEWNLAALAWFGFNDLYVAISADESGLADWICQRNVQRISEGAQPIVTLIEETPLGTIGAVSRLPAAVTDVVVVNVDNLTDLDLSDLYASHRASGATATIACHAQPFRIPFGRLELSGTRVTAYEEKPNVHVPISSGVYALSRCAVEFIPQDVRVDVPDLIDSILAAGKPVDAYRHSALWFDVNDEVALAVAAAGIAARAWSFTPTVTRRA